MQALPRKPRERASRHSSIEGVPGLDVEMDDIERRAHACSDRVQHDLRADVQELEAVRPRLETGLGAEVDGADLERRHSRVQCHLVGLPDTLGGLDDRDHGWPAGVERRHRFGRGLGQDDRVGADGGDRRQVIGVERGAARR